MIYFVAYSWSLHNKSGMGNVDIKCDSPIDSIQMIRKVEAVIKADLTGKESVAILSFQLLADERPATQEGGDK